MDRNCNSLFRIEGEKIRYLLCQNEASLVYMANLGYIELHTWNSRYRSPYNPDYLVLDINPLDIDFRYAVEVALATREVIEHAGAEGFCKTSGATGLHIYIPMGAKYTTEQVQQFAQLINLLANERLPKTTSLERLPDKRHGKMYLDYLQNHRGSTMAASYCLRPRKGTPVSAALSLRALRAQWRRCAASSGFATGKERPSSAQRLRKTIFRPSSI